MSSRLSPRITPLGGTFVNRAAGPIGGLKKARGAEGIHTATGTTATSTNAAYNMR